MNTERYHKEVNSLRLDEQKKQAWIAELSGKSSCEDDADPYNSPYLSPAPSPPSRRPAGAGWVRWRHLPPLLCFLLLVRHSSCCLAADRIQRTKADGNPPAIQPTPRNLRFPRTSTRPPSRRPVTPMLRPPRRRNGSNPRPPLTQTTLWRSFGIPIIPSTVSRKNRSWRFSTPWIPCSS